MKFYDLTPDEIKIIILSAGVMIAGLAIMHARNRDVPAPRVARQEAGTRALAEKTPVVVDVSGAVWRPDVYRLPEGSRVADALEEAMLRPDADVDGINRARILHDGQKLVVPSVSGPSSAAPEKEEYVDINSADVRLLKTLPSIGESRARDIIDYRERHGPFSSVEDLKNIPGIGDATVERLKKRAAAR